MTDTTDPGAFHARKANNYLRGTSGAVTAIHAAAANAEATLALAAEQRTANLIALAAVDATLGIDPMDSLRDAARRLGFTVGP